MDEQQLPHHSDQEIDAILEELQSRTAVPVSQPVAEITPENSGWRREMLEWFRSLGIAALVAVFLFGFVFRFVMVDGISMEPTLQDGDRLLMVSLFYQPDNGDIVILSDQTGLQKPLVKRVIATEGQTVELADGQVLVDGEPLEEPYVAEEWQDMGSFRYPLEIPEGCVFVLGDNRNHSTDSRSPDVGLVDEGEVLGKVFFRLFPFDRMGLVH